MLTTNDVFWMFLYELGRGADAATIAEHFKHASSAANSKRILYDSAERKNKGIAPADRSKFVMFREHAPKLLILGNCQAPNIARQIAAATNISVLGLEVMDYHENKEFFNTAIDSSDYIAACLLSPQFDEISTRALRLRDDLNKVFFCPMFFNGIHPDIVYWGRNECACRFRCGRLPFTHSVALLPSITIHRRVYALNFRFDV